MGTTGYPEAGVGGKQLGDPKYGEVHNNVPVSIEEFDFEYGEEYNKGTIQIRSSTLKTADNIALQLYVPLILKWVNLELFLLESLIVNVPLKI